MSLLVIVGQATVLLFQAALIRGSLRGWRLSLRRESNLVAMQDMYRRMLRDAMIGVLDVEQLLLELARIEVLVIDELHAQSVLRWWMPVPSPGDPWPDRMLGSVLDREEV